MKIKDLKYIAKQFKINKSTLRVRNVLLTFVKEQEKEIYGEEIVDFDMLDEETQRLLLNNFKKAYTGKIDIKLFEKEFKEEKYKKEEGFTYKMLLDIEKAATKEDFKNSTSELVQKIIDNVVVGSNYVIAIMQGDVLVDGVARNIVVTTINKVKNDEMRFVFDDSEEKFEYTSTITPTINMSSPVDAFAYPLMEDANIVRNKLIYYSSKSDSINTSLVNNVLECNINLTANQEKVFFNQILLETLGKEICPKDLHKLYKEIEDSYSVDEFDEERLVDIKTFKMALKKLSIDTLIEVEDAYDNAFGFTDYVFKAMNVLPNQNKKSIKIKNDDAEINVMPTSLENLHQVQNKNGELFIMIPITKDVMANGFNLPIEQIEDVI